MFFKAVTLILTLSSVLMRLSHQQTIIETGLRFLAESEKQQETEPQDVNQLFKKYDFIIVGAGTAGCVLANRLTENPKWNVLLLEAGQPESFILDVPLLVHYLQLTNANWKYKTEPSDKYCLGMNNLQCNWPRGKVVGGSSAINYMIYTRGNRRDYDNWKNMGNERWSFNDVLPYFKKIENFTIDASYNQHYHNKNGYLSISYAPYRTPLANAIVTSSIEYGLPYVDYNGRSQTGVSNLQLTMKDGLRHSSSRAYLHPIRNRSNLHVKKYATVTKILVDQSKRACGVEFIVDGATTSIYATKEVILSAGAINSPQLLMLSGIGPKKHLRDMKIPLVKNLKVGYNLMDHVAVGGLTFVIDKGYSVKISDMTTWPIMGNFMVEHNGPITLPGGCEVLVLADLQNVNNSDGHPDIELLYQAGGIATDKTLRNTLGLTNEIYDAVFKQLEDKSSFMVMPMLMRPKSKGKILLRSKNYLDKPRVFPNYFAHQEELDTLVGGIKLAIDICKQPTLQKLGCRLHDAVIPKCAKFNFGSHKYWECHARHFSFTIYHASGTCKMGPVSDKSAVVDPRLRVHGVKGLRVIDASIIPEIPVAHTNAPTYMIAEKGSDMIKEDWG